MVGRETGGVGDDNDDDDDDNEGAMATSAEYLPKFIDIVTSCFVE
jgi:hypothetical protein